MADVTSCNRTLNAPSMTEVHNQGTLSSETGHTIMSELCHLLIKCAPFESHLCGAVDVQDITWSTNLGNLYSSGHGPASRHQDNSHTLWKKNTVHYVTSCMIRWLRSYSVLFNWVKKANFLALDFPTDCWFVLLCRSLVLLFSSWTLLTQQTSLNGGVWKANKQRKTSQTKVALKGASNDLKSLQTIEEMVRISW